jgi:CheY-like chemotaxis protein
MDDSSIISVLLVDDSPQLVFFYQRYLEKNGCGCECEFAECERVAWEMPGERQFDLVLSLYTSRGTSRPSTREKIRRVMNVVYHRGQKFRLLPMTDDGNPVRFVTQSCLTSCILPGPGGLLLDLADTNVGLHLRDFGEVPIDDHARLDV